MFFWNQPAADKVRATQLKEAQLHLLDHQTKFEYHGAMVPMLESRIERLLSEVKEVSIPASAAARGMSALRELGAFKRAAS